MIDGILVGKPQDEAYYSEYKPVLKEVIANENLPVVYNVNFGHCVPRCALPYGVTAKINMNESRKLKRKLCSKAKSILVTIIWKIHFPWIIKR